MIYKKSREMEKAVRELEKRIQGKVLHRVLMKRYTSFRIGGLAEIMVLPETTEGIISTVDFCVSKGLPWRVIGKGTNLLVRDGGLEEVVINMSNSLEHVEVVDDSTVKAGAGLRLARLVKYCQVAGLEGMEWAAGIPGTIGGAVVMNAGAEGSDISKVLSSALMFRPGEGQSRLERKTMDFSYRHLERPDSTIFLEAEFSLKPGAAEEIRETIVESLKRRRLKQPLSMPSAGSIFKNPPGDFAGRLIEEAGLKAARVGDAQVSEIHANFIVNRGRARARDAIELIDLVRNEVKKRTGIELELEVEVIGRD